MCAGRAGEPERCADDVLAVLDEELDATHASLRTTETNAGNLVADALLAAVHADFAVVHSGLLKADAVFPKARATHIPTPQTHPPAYSINNLILYEYNTVWSSIYLYLYSVHSTRVHSGIYS